eukprot:8518862-Pyramimonas_sp.AAC.1
MARNVDDDLDALDVDDDDADLLPIVALKTHKHVENAAPTYEERFRPPSTSASHVPQGFYRGREARDGSPFEHTPSSNCTAPDISMRPTFRNDSIGFRHAS